MKQRTLVNHWLSEVEHEWEDLLPLPQGDYDHMIKLFDWPPNSSFDLSLIPLRRRYKCNQERKHLEALEYQLRVHFGKIRQ